MVVLIADVRFEDLGTVGAEETAEVGRIEAQEITVDRKLLCLAILFDDDVDSGFGAGEGRERECDDGSATVVSADTVTFINRRTR